MANANPSRLGQINGAGDTLAMMLKVFSGEVLGAFDRTTISKDKHIVRSIPFGKSAQFPATGRISGFYHTPGEEITGNRVNANEKVINIEGLYIAPAFVSNIDEWMNHYDVRSIYSHEIGEALANKYDLDTLRSIVNAARITAPLVNGVFAGDVLDGTLTDAGYATTGATIFGGIWDAGVLLDQRFVPMSDRYATLRPVQYALLVKTDNKQLDVQYTQNRNGGLDVGTVKLVNNIPVFKTNNLPSADDRAATDQPAIRQKDYSVTQGLVWHKSAAGTVQLQDIVTEAQYDMRRQGWLTLGKYMCGKDTLRPESAIELQSGAPS